MGRIPTIGRERARPPRSARLAHDNQYLLLKYWRLAGGTGALWKSRGPS
jgi:hypothetical protein